MIDRSGGARWQDRNALRVSVLFSLLRRQCDRKAMRWRGVSGHQSFIIRASLVSVHFQVTPKVPLCDRRYDFGGGRRMHIGVGDGVGVPALMCGSGLG